MRILAKRARFILVVAFGSALVALVVLQFVPRTYRGEAMLIFPKTENSTALLSKLGGIPGLVDLGVPGLSGQGMYSDVLQSRTLSSRIVDELQLSAVEVKPEDLQEQLELTPTKAGALQLACYASTGWVKSGKLKWLDQKMPRASVKEKTAYLAAEITNLYVKRLQDFDREHSHVTSKSHRVFLQGEVDKTHRQLSDAENALRHFKELHPVVVPPEAVEAQVTQVVELRKAQIEAASELGEVEQSIDEARKVVAGQTAVLTAAKVIQENPVVTELQNQLAAAEVQRARMLENMTEKHPSVVAATEQAAKLQEKIGKEVARVTSSETIEINPVRQALVQNLATLEIRKSGTEARVAGLNDAMASVERDLSANAKEQMRYVRLFREVKATEAVYTSLLTEYSKARVDEAKEPEGFTVVDWAVPEEFQAKPKIKLTVLAVFLMGAIIAGLISIIQASLRPSKLRSAKAEEMASADRT